MRIAKIRYQPKRRDSQKGFIEVDGECIHTLENLDEFYKVFGYTADVAKAGILPEEFVWETYIKGNEKYTHCLQIHLIQYLNTYSPAFIKKYGDQSGAWLAVHATSVTGRNQTCATCGMRPDCSEH